jgi:hypothetical protein
VGEQLWRPEARAANNKLVETFFWSRANFAVKPQDWTFGERSQQDSRNNIVFDSAIAKKLGWGSVTATTRGPRSASPRAIRRRCRWGRRMYRSENFGVVTTVMSRLRCSELQSSPRSALEADAIVALAI